MKLGYLIENIDKSDSNTEKWFCLEQWVQECNLSCYGIGQPCDNQRFVAYWLGNHICTDTWVGLRVYFLDEKPVAISHQSSRKGDEDIEWFSEEAYLSVREYLLSLSEEDEPDIPTKFVNMEDEMGEGYPIQYTEQALRKEVLYKGKLVDITKDNGEGYTNFHTITIKEKDTSREVDIDVREILVPWYTNKESK